MTDPTKEDIAYPRDLFSALIHGNSPYAFYLFQWVPYQTDAKRWRLKMQHDVRTFDGREAFNVWPNGRHCGPFTDDEVEFIRISRSQFGDAWQDPRDTTQAATEPTNQTQWDRVYALIHHWAQRALAAEGALQMLGAALSSAWKAGELPASVLTGEQVRSYRAVLAKIP